MRYPDGGGLSAVARANREQVRFKAADMFARGLTPPQVARALRVTPSSASTWHRLWKQGGKQALASKGPGGSLCRLSQEQIVTLEAELDRGPGTHGWDDQRWTLARVTTLIKELFRIDYCQRPSACRRWWPCRSPRLFVVDYFLIRRAGVLVRACFIRKD
ncbi:helix-turn-helix domain-containing protein, partial [Nonomuraea marmarensis]|uniref:helix-turn-helix domain-containing protein n=1 Tax=Nonomuraea marmarensis TaxID=3351344 RepID=UPI0037122F02